MTLRLMGCVALLGLLSIGALHAGQAQENAAVDHAKQIFDLLSAEKFGDVAQEFNAQVAAALPESQLSQVWSTFSQQVGPFKAFIDQRVTTPAAARFRGDRRIAQIVLGLHDSRVTAQYVSAPESDADTPLVAEPARRSAS